MDMLGKPSRDDTCGFVTTTAYEKLRAENAKLRELCADMLAQLLNAYDPKELTEFLDRLHGLGIEVCE